MCRVNSNCSSPTVCIIHYQQCIKHPVNSKYLLTSSNSKVEKSPLPYFFSFQNNPKDLDPSCKMDLDLWNCLGRVKLVL